MSDCTDFAERKFRLECSSLHFERQGRQPLKFWGLGHISQTNDGKLEYLAHVDAAVVQRIRAVHKSASSRPSGTVLKKEDYFKFEATSYSGPSWTGRVAEPSLRTRLSGPGIVYGSVPEIRSEHQLLLEELSDYATLFLPNPIDFPTNSATQTLVLRNQIERNNASAYDCAAFKIGPEEFLIYNTGLHAEIECTLEKGSIDANRHLRMREALEFALGQLIIPCAFELISGNKKTTILRSSVFGPEWVNKQQPPLRFDNVPFQPEVYSMVESYYRAFLHKHDKEGHPISAGLFSLIKTAWGPLELQTLAASVAAETLIEAGFKKIVPLDDTFRSEVKDFIAHLDRGSLSKGFYSRLKGSLDSMLVSLVFRRKRGIQRCHRGGPRVDRGRNRGLDGNQCDTVGVIFSRTKG